MTNPVHNEFYREYDLSEKRRTPPRRSPAAHQQTALAKLHAWSESRGSHAPVSGGLLVLPTGGGKTFTANRFLCAGPLSQGFKVLWLAHTHHLLEQALDSLEHELGHIQEPKATFAARVVSGTVSHCRPHEIKPTDDMIIVTLQTMVSALRNELPPVLDFLAAAGSQLCVVFDEAHHAPAHSYRRLIAVLRERCPGMLLLGLTATPTYTDETKRGWLATLFPQGLIHQVTAQELMATGILAKPIFEDHQTDIAVAFDERAYEQWRSTYQDLPESMVTQLAQSRERNQFIAQTYAEHRERYGKTIMFADRWFQCEQLSEFLQARGVRAGVLYSHVDADPGSVAARNQRSSDENTTVLQAFKNGALDVLINVRMLTEGTDVPSVSTVFLTRQSTSGILLTQMIGRALRGPAFGGTKQAYIVAFIDQWKHLINWADYRDIGAGHADDTAATAAPRLPIQLISIELVRQLVQQMDGGSVETRPFLTLMPVGWYRVEFTALVAGSDDLEIVRQMVMVFEDEIAGYDAWRAALTPAVYADFAATDLDFAAERGQLAEWRQAFFGTAALNRGEDLLVNLFHMARHLAQNEGAVTFFPFAEREHHDLDRVVAHFLDENITMRDELPAVRAEYDRTDRYWRTIYPGFHQFKKHYDECKNRLLLGSESTTTPVASTRPELRPNREPSEEIKRQVLARDSQRCLSCGENSTRKLHVDHVAPSYMGGINDLGNLQTLCRQCNLHKSIAEINFRVNGSPLRQPPTTFTFVPLAQRNDVQIPEVWEKTIRRSLNFFYRCAAVDSIRIGKRGSSFYTWEIVLYTGNDPQWLELHLPDLLAKLQQHCSTGGRIRPQRLQVSVPDGPGIVYPPGDPR